MSVEGFIYSISIRNNSSRRIGIDDEKNEFVVFDKTINNKYHGQVRTFAVVGVLFTNYGKEEN